jgi:hypothetical protein
MLAPSLTYTLSLLSSTAIDRGFGIGTTGLKLESQTWVIAACELAARLRAPRRAARLSSAKRAAGEAFAWAVKFLSLLLP